MDNGVHPPEFYSIFVSGKNSDPANNRSNKYGQWCPLSRVIFDICVWEKL